LAGGPVSKHKAIGNLGLCAKTRLPTLFKHRITKSSVESLVNKIKIIKIHAYRFRDKEYFKLRLYRLSYLEARVNRMNVKKHRLMIVTHDLAIGGLQQVVVNLCKYINRDRFDISVLCLRGMGELAEEVKNIGIPVYCTASPDGRIDYLSFLKVAKIFKEKKPEIIHTHNSQPFIDATLAGLLSDIKTIVHTDHARKFPDKRRYMFLEWLASHFAYRIVGVSEHTCANLIRYEKISRKKLVTVVNGIDKKKYAIQIDVKKKREELGISKYDLVIGLGVRLTEQKGIAYLLEALPQVLKKFPSLGLLIAGNGPLLNPLKRKAIEFGVSDNVLFLGPRLDMPEILKTLDLYVLPSIWEGLPMVILEAMASKCPVLATDVGGNSMAIVNGISGSLVRSRDPRALSSEIIRILSDKNLREKYALNSLEIFNNKFTADVMAKRYEKLYLRLE
jgi:glycosyltransferase involved in cell wall biosynthesis